MIEPQWLVLARREIGVGEIVGPKHNPVVLDYSKRAGVDGIGTDEVPWCAAFVGALLEDAGITGSKSLMARSYSRWGEAVDPNRIPIGAVCVLSSSRGPASGHVGFVVAASRNHVWLLGGNQNNAVNIARFPRSVAGKPKVVALRYPKAFPQAPYSIAPARSPVKGGKVSDA